MGNRENKELIRMTHGNELRWGNVCGRGGKRMGEKVQGTRSINGRYKIDRGKLSIV